MRAVLPQRVVTKVVLPVACGTKHGLGGGMLALGLSPRPWFILPGNAEAIR